MASDDVIDVDSCRIRFGVQLATRGAHRYAMEGSFDANHLRGPSNEDALDDDILDERTIA